MLSEGLSFIYFALYLFAWSCIDLLCLMYINLIYIFALIQSRLIN